MAFSVTSMAFMRCRAAGSQSKGELPEVSPLSLVIECMNSAVDCTVQYVVVLYSGECPNETDLL